MFVEKPLYSFSNYCYLFLPLASVTTINTHFYFLLCIATPKYHITRFLEV